MKFGIDWSQASTKRGAMWVIVGLIGTVGWWFGKDVTGIILLGSTISGAMGFAIKD